jgi:hypothetical protein
MINWKVFRETLLFSIVIWVSSMVVYLLNNMANHTDYYKLWAPFVVVCIIASIALYLLSYYCYGKIKGKSVRIVLINVIQYSLLYILLVLNVELYAKYKYKYAFFLSDIYIYIYIILYIYNLIYIYSVVKHYDTNK